MGDLLGDGGGAGFPISTEGASAGAEGVSPARPTKRRSRGARLRRGSRDVKDYPVTESELWQLGGTGVGATFCFSIASWFLSKSIDLYLQLKVNTDSVSVSVDYMRGMQFGFMWAGLVPLFIGFALFVRGGFLVHRIVHETNHYD